MVTHILFAAPFTNLQPRYRTTRWRPSGVGWTSWRRCSATPTTRETLQRPLEHYTFSPWETWIEFQTKWYLVMGFSTFCEYSTYNRDIFSVFQHWGSQKKLWDPGFLMILKRVFVAKCRSVMSGVRSGGRGPRLRGGRSGGRSEWSSEMSEENLSRNHQTILRSHNFLLTIPVTLKNEMNRDLKWDPIFALAMRSPSRNWNWNRT